MIVFPFWIYIIEPKIQIPRSPEMFCFGLNCTLDFVNRYHLSNPLVYSEENLKAALGKMGIGGRTLEDVMDKVRNRHYQVKLFKPLQYSLSLLLLLLLSVTNSNYLFNHFQLACTLTFEAIHATSCDSGINHPNQYFSESRKILQPKVTLISAFSFKYLPHHS